MFDKWNREFDRVCGANITDRETEPLADSGVWDILHGERVDGGGGRVLSAKSADDTEWSTSAYGEYPALGDR